MYRLGLNAYTPNANGAQPQAGCTPQNAMPTSLPWQCWLFSTAWTVDCWSCEDIIANLAQNAVVYNNLPAPPASLVAPPPAVGAGTSTTPAPYDCTVDGSCPGYDAAVSDAIAAGSAQTKQNVSDWFSSVAAGLPATSDSSGIPLWVWIGGAGLLAFALVAVGGGSPSRYGR